MSEGETAISIRNVDIVFAANPAPALKLLDEGRSREEILAATNAVLGAAGVSLEVKRGEICVLMGLSGSGKSTILRAINRLNEVSRGEILVADEGQMINVASCEAETLRRLRQRRVTMVFQQFALLPWRTVRENVGFGLELRGMTKPERDAVVDQKLAMVGLSKWADKFANELSGGMQQRVGLARAFATDADILLMDEPFSALDPLIRTKLQDELLSLQKELKKTIVFVSHDLDEALKLGNHIAIMEGGRVVQYGPPEDIILKPVNDYVREFVANVNPLNVLSAYNVMRDARDLEPAGEGWLWLDRRRTTRFRLGPDRKVVQAEAMGSAATWVATEDAGKPFPEGAHVAFWARQSTPLRHVMHAMQRDAGPVAVFDAEDHLVGAIGVRDVLGAVLRREQG
ncbi:choline ABC transporter ATP-binding protein [Prosthecomicrobium hirschii]|uniref:Trimethylamine N-oxide transport system ATP-binding protein TmoW n=1 Tax=Prosthecodimorpha hirschii TaxID=665126 RepID=A0A0P6VIP7_9HYPH|nr:choline ABC transporter ATP-binding protein [Prosthecomicrobium hirschii]KPL50964.1 ABC transporter ATP-binding protein [Prosthecomicrobium hirschii]MCW1839220.1 choline ABC transporter ATP-binding protein [Prosthecomicrobium hirschii]